MGAGHCQWGGYTDQILCNIHGEEHLASRRHAMLIPMNGPQRTACLAKGYINELLSAEICTSYVWPVPLPDKNHVDRSIGCSRRGGYGWTHGHTNTRKESPTIIMDIGLMDASNLNLNCCHIESSGII